MPATISAGATRTTVKNRINGAVKHWRGSAAATGIVSWGDARSQLNSAASALGLDTFSNGETGSTVRARINAIIEAIPLPWWLYASDEVGPWFDPSDTATMFQDAAGTTPAVAGQPVGLVLDKSKNLVRGADLFAGFPVGIGTWVNNGNGSWSIDGSQTTNQDLDGDNSITASAGDVIEWTVTISGLASGTLTLFFNNSGPVYYGNGTHTIQMTRNSALLRVRAGAGQTATVSGFSAKVIAGYHASQSTAAARPIYGVIPDIRRRNLLRYSEQFDNAGKYGVTVSADVAAAPDGGTSADAIIPSTDGGVSHSFDISVSASGTLTASLYAKPNGYDFISIALNNNAALGAFFNLSTGAVSNIGASVLSTDVVDAGNGWKRISLSVNTAIANIRYYVSPAATYSVYAGDGTSGVYVWGAQLETGSTATEYQRIGAAFDPRRNLLTYSEQFDNAAWRKTGVSVSTDADGFFKLVEDATTNIHRLDYPLSSGAATYTVSADVKAAGRNLAELWVLNNNNTIGAGTRFNLSTGAVVSSREVGGATHRGSNIETLGGGIYRITITVVQTVAEAYTSVFASDGVSTGLSYAGDGVSGILVRKTQLETGSTATSYQRVGANQYDVTEAGVETLHYLHFDGVDDFLVTPSINFTGSDEMSVFVGVRKLSDATAMLIELSAIVGSNTGTFYLTAPENTSIKYASAARGDTSLINGNRADITASGAAPDTAVITAMHDISGDLSTIRRNGIAGTDGTTDKGPGNFGNYPLYIGMRAGASFPFSGRLYGLAIRGKTSTAAEIADTESYLAAKSGVALS